MDGKESVLLVEILLSLVSRPSVLYRRLASQVFSAYTGVMDGEALESLFLVNVKVLFLLMIADPLVGLKDTRDSVWTRRII